MSVSSNLADVLGHEADLYDELVDLLAEEETALIAGNTRAVADCMARSETLVLKLRLLETSRQTLVAQLTGDRQTRLGDLPGADDEPLGRARARLQATLPRVERMNRRVTALLERSLRLFDATLDLLRDAAGVGRHYTARGELAGAGFPMIDGRA
jgi:flagellar biosynthesis/type III secretory pathway chaperone